MMRRLLGITLAGFLALGLAGSAGAATISYTGTLSLHLSGLPGVTAHGGGVALVNGSAGVGHLSSLAILGGALGPVTASVPVTTNSTINSVIFSGMAMASVTPVIGGAGAPAGLTGTAKICLVFAPCAYASVVVPLTPAGGVGFGVGGTQSVPGAVAVTMQHNPWTLGQPTMTTHAAGTTTFYWTHYEGSLYTHTPGSNYNLTTTAGTAGFPKAFAHGPASGTTSTALPGGVLQLVSVTKAYTSLTGAFPELPIFATLRLNFIPEPGTLLLLGTGVMALAVYGRRRHSR